MKARPWCNRGDPNSGKSTRMNGAAAMQLLLDAAEFGKFTDLASFR
jgi:hypothetical protein